MLQEAAPSAPVLVLEGPESGSDDLAGRIAGLGFRAIRCETIAQAEHELETTADAIGCALVPAEFADKRLKRALKGLRGRGPRKGLVLVAVGEPSGREARRQLRNAGVTLALWEPFDDPTLRFILNHATQHGSSADLRRAERVPARIPASLTLGTRERDVIVYSLSRSGAYFETPRACMSGARVRSELRLPDGPIALDGVVAFSNVPGNLERPNLPHGIGVRFVDVDEASGKRLAGYIETRRAQLCV